nr:SNF2 domain-containing protein CLASSY 4-like [Tanacetum cinerariifolium]
MELLKLCKALEEKVLVFIQYIKHLEFIMQLIETNFKWVEGIECMYMDGQQNEKKINKNAYKIELLGHYNVSATFDVSDLSPYFRESEDEENSRTSFSQAGEDDAGALDRNKKIRCQRNQKNEMEVDGLFDEMRLCLQSLEIGSSGASMANRGYADFLADRKDQVTYCFGGKHHLTINDEFGIICKYCSFVEIEIRDILPPMCTNGRGGHGRHDINKSDRMKFSDFKLSDCNQEHLHAVNGSQYEKGTVWDLVPGVKNSMNPHQREGFEFI